MTAGGAAATIKRRLKIEPGPRMNDRDVDDGLFCSFIQTRLMFPVFVLMRTETEIEYEREERFSSFAIE